ncbi:uncharacterized protein V1516DRAFT_691562 [Lipomyces oligophaga]|uniref:uncharacterized protein n=1 Tax=Lipomyces oligophaga TaxID=45792 RepID=UPI0034CF509E
MSSFPFVFNVVFSTALFLSCLITLIFMYKWAIRPVMEYYNISIPLHDISGYLATLRSREPNNESGDLRSGPIALEGPDILVVSNHDRSNMTDDIDGLEAGIGVSNLNRGIVGVVEARSDRLKLYRGKHGRAIANEDEDDDVFFDSQSAFTVIPISSQQSGQSSPGSQQLISGTIYGDSSPSCAATLRNVPSAASAHLDLDQKPTTDLTSKISEFVPDFVKLLQFRKTSTPNDNP